ncbi:MAG: hypothetical protein ACI8ZM_004263 [Crocinitomix sp.]|jgi:hypothetical protein
MDIAFVVLFLALPISSIALLFLRDSIKLRKIIMNILLILNALIFLSLLIFAFLNTSSGGSMWSERPNGGGAIIWVYFYVAPFCGLIQLILTILKIIFAANSKPKTNKSIWEYQTENSERE